MNKLYKFKFESVLKLKRFHEEKIKNQLGDLEKSRQDLLGQIEDTTKGIDVYYQEQEALAGNAKMREISHYPNIIWANVKKRESLHLRLSVLVKNIEEKQLELAKARGEVKVFEKLREEDLKVFKNKVSKFEDLEREENYQMRAFYLQRLEGEKR